MLTLIYLYLFLLFKLITVYKAASCVEQLLLHESRWI